VTRYSPMARATRRPFTPFATAIAYGPGVADMKAGLVMNCFVLAAFAKFGGSPAPLVGLFTGDEEIGSPEGRAVIEAEARRAPRGVQQRAGPRLRQRGDRAQGRRVHGVPGERSRRALRAPISPTASAPSRKLARKVQALHALTDLDRGITLNVGLISGGQSVNNQWRRGRRARSTLRYVSPPDPRRRDGTDRRDHRAQLRARVPRPN